LLERLQESLSCSEDAPIQLERNGTRDNPTDNISKPKVSKTLGREASHLAKVECNPMINNSNQKKIIN